MHNARKFDELYEYEGALGVIYSKDKTTFKVWSPVASEMSVILYEKGDSKSYFECIKMQKYEKGLWQAEVLKDLKGFYYNYLVTYNGSSSEAVDPYAKAVNVNGTRGMIIDLKDTDPEGWKNDIKPELKSPCDSILYEMHIRDFSIDENSGVSDKYKGKYEGVWEPNTKNPKSSSKTCLSHLVELGITTVHLLPTFDYATVNEEKFNTLEYNWGYDPENFNVPEGSYSLNPFDGSFRIKEFKEMVLQLHKAGIRVVMDVVYNHTFKTSDSNLNKIVPEYYYRQDEEGNFSSGSGCGNELATERVMVRKFIEESIIYWAKEYHIDGFRFDLMGLYDTETIIKIRHELDKIDKSIIMYGEGWTGGDSPLPASRAALKVNTVKYGSMQIAAFNDNIRDAIKGHVFNAEEKGFVNGQEGFEEAIKFGVVAATYHKDLNYNNIDSCKEPWANEPYQSITYESAHDNYTLWDKLKVSTNANDKELIAMNKLCAAIIFTSQGIPFLHAGEEFARTKKNADGSLIDNSYKSPDYVNKIYWDRKDEYNDLFKYYKGLIKLRRSHPAFRMDTNVKIQDNLKFMNFTKKNIVGFSINGKALNDSWNKIIVIYNARNEDITIELDEDNYNIAVDGSTAGNEKLHKVIGKKTLISRKSCYVFFK